MSPIYLICLTALITTLALMIIGDILSTRKQKKKRQEQLTIDMIRGFEENLESMKENIFNFERERIETIDAAYKIAENIHSMAKTKREKELTLMTMNQIGNLRKK